MTISGRIYQAILRRPAPRWLKENSLSHLVWKLARKVLNVLIIPTCPINAVRIWLYRVIGFKIGKRVFIGMRCYMDDMYPSRTVIEDRVTISYCVVFAAHGPAMKNPKIVIRKGAIVSAHATILGGADIGQYATIGAGTLVCRPVPPFSVAVGVPARVIRNTPIPGTYQANMYALETGHTIESADPAKENE